VGLDVEPSILRPKGLRRTGRLRFRLHYATPDRSADESIKCNLPTADKNCGIAERWGF
jgi:hypothetical protein